MGTQVGRRTGGQAALIGHCDSCIVPTHRALNARSPLAEGLFKKIGQKEKEGRALRLIPLTGLEGNEPITESLMKAKHCAEEGRIVSRRGRSFISDTIAGLSFYIPVCIPVEMALAGMTFGQSLHARLASIPFNLVLSGAYGIFRNWSYKITKTNSESSQARKFVVDLAVSIVGQIPFYALIVASSGASFRQVLVSCASMAAVSPLLGRPLGVWYDFMRRRIFHMPPAGACVGTAESGKESLPAPLPK